MAEPKSSRTEKPTGKRLTEARQDGNVPRTTELSQVLVMATFLIFCRLFGADWLEQLKGLMEGCFASLDLPDLNPAQWVALMKSMGSISAHLLMVPVGLMAVASVSGHLVQGAPPFTLKPMKPKFSKLNPMKGMKKLFQVRSLVNLGKAVFKTTLFTVVAVMAVRDALVDGLPGAPGAAGALNALFTIIGKVIFRIVLIWLVLALIDLLYTRYQYFRDLMMTKQEVKEERKQTEGDPRVKARIRSKQFELARMRMMAEVPRASVVVTNPTHYAVALRYVPAETDVPQLLAKGQNLLAQRIREIAEEHRIPIVSDPPLARALYRSVPVGGFIPEKLYRAVAEILALVMQRRRPVRRPAEEVRP